MELYKGTGGKNYYVFPESKNQNETKRYIEEVRKKEKQKPDRYKVIDGWTERDNLWFDPVKGGKKVTVVTRK